MLRKTLLLVILGKCVKRQLRQGDPRWQWARFGAAAPDAARWRRTAWTASPWPADEGLGGKPGDLVARHIPQVLVDGPAVPERVDELAGAISPERVMDRLERFRARIQGPLPDRVGVLNGQMKRPVGATQCQRGDDAHVGELITDRQRAVTKPQLDGQHLAARQGDPALL